MDQHHGRLDPTDTPEAVRVLQQVRSTPGSWCNLHYEELEDSESVDSPLFGFLAARGPANPFATIMQEGGGKPLSVGIQHQAGTKAAAQLREVDLAPPAEGRVRQDHPRRGLVVEWPDSSSTEALAKWLFPAMRELNRTRISETVGWSWTVPS